MAKLSFVGAGILGVALIVVPMTARAQGVEIGKREYVNHCAVCHGNGGKGDGPLAKIIESKTADLTVLQKNNKGVFPFNRVYDMIDGRAMVKGHGTRQMPIWGTVYNEQAPQWFGPEGNVPPRYYAEFVRGRILALIGYIDTLQVK